MKRMIIVIIAFIICCILIALSAALEVWWLTLIGTVAEIILGCIFAVSFDYFLTKGNNIKLLFQSIKYYNKEIRLSFSYLFKIEVEGKYLLVKGNRIQSQFQPIGGVYKYYTEAKPTLESFEYRPDIRMGNEKETDDLRIVVKGKYLLKFVDWFLSMKDREYDPYREFKEELLDTKLIDTELFPTLKYRKILVHKSNIEFSTYLQCDELLYSDIFELNLNQKQIEAIKKSVKDNPEKLCLATDKELLSECYNGIEKNVGNNAKWLLGG